MSTTSYDCTKFLEKILQFTQLKLEFRGRWDDLNELDTLIVSEILKQDSQIQIDMIKKLSALNIRFYLTDIFIQTSYTNVLDCLVQLYSKRLHDSAIKNILNKDDMLFTYKTNLLEKIVELQSKDDKKNNTNNNLSNHFG